MFTKLLKYFDCPKDDKCKYCKASSRDYYDNKYDPHNPRMSCKRYIKGESVVTYHDFE